MQTALLILLVCAAMDLVAFVLLLGVVWLEGRRMRKEAALAGETMSSASGQFGCLIALGLVGLVLIYGVAWIVLQ